MKIQFNAITNCLDNVPGFIVHDSSVHVKKKKIITFSADETKPSWAGINNIKRTVCSLSLSIQDVDEFVSSSEQKCSITSLAHQ